MRRLMMIFVIGCAALGLGLGLMLNSSSPGSSKNTAAGSDTTVPEVTSTTARVLAEQATRPTTPEVVTTATTVTTAAPTTTRPAVTTTTRAATAARVTTTTRKTTATTKPAAAKKPAADCGTGSTTVGLNGQTTADGVAHVTATVKNQNTKAVDIDKLVVRLTYGDGTTHDITVPGAAGTKIDSGAEKVFEFTDSAPGTTLTQMDILAGGFGYHTDGQSNCAVS